MSNNLLLCKARINDKNHSVNCQRRLGDVRRNDDLTTDRSVWSLRRRRFKNPLLKIRRKGWIERNALEFPDLRSQIIHFPLDSLTRFLYFLNEISKHQRQQHSNNCQCKMIAMTFLYKHPSDRIQTISQTCIHKRKPQNHQNSACWVTCDVQSTATTVEMTKYNVWQNQRHTLDSRRKRSVLPNTETTSPHDSHAVIETCAETWSRAYLLPCEEEKYVSLRLLAHVDLDNGTNGRLQVIAFRLRSVEDLDRMSTTGNAHQRSIVKVLLQRQETWIRHQMATNTRLQRLICLHQKNSECK